MSSFRFQVFADYHQFYIWDQHYQEGAATQYEDIDLQRMVKAERYVLTVQPVRNMTVPVELQIHDQMPEIDLTKYDHAVECSLEVPSGDLQIHECTGGVVADIKVKPGTYEVLVLFQGLGSISEDGLDGQDQYTVILSLGSHRDLKVLKQYNYYLNNNGNNS